MNIRELKEQIKDLPDDMKIGGSGHYGEFLDINYTEVQEVKSSYDMRKGDTKFKIFCINMEDRGSEPD